MSVTWKTKYGMRSVRVDPPPTVEDALFAAEGLTPIVEQRVAIAAGLLLATIEEVRSEAKRILGEKTSSHNHPGRQARIDVIRRSRAKDIAAGRLSPVTTERSRLYERAATSNSSATGRNVAEVPPSDVRGCNLAAGKQRKAREEQRTQALRLREVVPRQRILQRHGRIDEDPALARQSLDIVARSHPYSLQMSSTSVRSTIEPCSATQTTLTGFLCERTVLISHRMFPLTSDRSTRTMSEAATA